MAHQEFSSAKAIQTAVEHHLKGNLSQAESIYRQVLQVEPSNPDALNLLGVIAYQCANSEAAVELISRAIAINCAAPEYHNNLGNALRSLHRLDEAAGSYRKALRLAPRSAEAHNNLALVMREQGRLSEAVAAFRRALKLQPDSPEIHCNLGTALQDLGKFDEAVALFIAAIRLRPDYAEAHNNLGSALKFKGQPVEAVTHYREALRLKPNLAEAHSNMGVILHEQGQLDQAAECFRTALRLKPDSATAYLNLGAVMQEAGLMGEAASHYTQALALQPNLIAARWGHCFAQIPILYDRHEDIAASRSRYHAQLAELSSSISLKSPEAIESAARAVGGAQPFFLAYQGQNDRELQQHYGRLVCRIQAARYPRWSQQPAMPEHRTAEPLRVGFVSGFFWQHSNWKIPIKGWVENLDRERFQLFGYYTSGKNDSGTEAARCCFSRFVQNVATVEEMCRIIREDNLHALIYPEVGMDPMTVRLAALRLVPVQCTSWGHPDTSGLPTIDYYLSSDLMEPPDAEAHYTERLVRLPNLSIFYIPPETEPATLERSQLGLREDAILFFCSQSLFKYLPQHDDLFPRIAREVGNCQFVFLKFGKSEAVNERFLQRLKTAFGRHGLNSEQFVAMLPQQDAAHYKALNRICDVFLDSIGWSGCNSTLEAVACDLPVVTLPGQLMRGRHSLAILKMMGVTETIAETEEDYVSIAARLASDRALHHQVSQKIQQTRHRVYRDRKCIDHLADFLEAAVARPRA